MHVDYRISDIIVRIDYTDNDEVFDRLHEVFTPAATTESLSPTVCVTLHSRSPVQQPPDRSIKEYDWLGESKYTLDDLIYISQSGVASLRLDLSASALDLHYPSPSAQVAFLLRRGLKWLIICTAGAQNHLYIHGSGVHYDGLNVVFAGHSGSGKSSALTRLLHAGGRAISDDVILLHNQTPVRIPLVSTVRKDSKQRFTGSFGVSGEHPSSFWADREQLAAGVKLVVFPRIWNNPTSYRERIEPTAAHKLLFDIYEMEASWNVKSRPYSWYEQGLRANLPSAVFYVFYAGSDEDEVTGSLFDLIREVSNGRKDLD